jgi:hypothetical protein
MWCGSGLRVVFFGCKHAAVMPGAGFFKLRALHKNQTTPAASNPLMNL